MPYFTEEPSTDTIMIQKEPLDEEKSVEEQDMRLEEPDIDIEEPLETTSPEEEEETISNDIINEFIDNFENEEKIQEKKKAFEIEYAEEEQLVALMLAAYEKVAVENERPDGLLFPKDIYALMYSTLNPDKDTIHPDEDILIRTAAEELIQHQGLLNDKIPVHNGFITRGNPLGYMRRLAVDMHHHRRRRLQSNNNE